MTNILCNILGILFLLGILITVTSILFGKATMALITVTIFYGTAFKILLEIKEVEEKP